MARSFGATFARRALLTLLVLGPLVVVLDRLDAAGTVALFVLAATALIPLAWVIGEATENAAHYTGAGFGGFLNATFGNAPELIVALVAVSNGLPDVVRASLVGSIAGNLLLVLGFTLLLGRTAEIDRTSALISLAQVAVVTLVLLVPALPGLYGDPNRRSLAVLSLAVGAAILAARLVVNRYVFRRQRRLLAASEPQEAAGWSLRAALLVLGLATVITAFVTETLVGSLQAFAAQAHLSEFFVAAVIVAIVGNAAEHGSAVLLARRGNVELATEIALASGAQVAAFLIPAVALISWSIDPLALSLRPVELLALGCAPLLAGAALGPGRTTHRAGATLLAVYAGLVVVLYLAGDR
jgi:Ca2+:H+ antiporter